MHWKNHYFNILIFKSENNFSTNRLYWIRKIFQNTCDVWIKIYLILNSMFYSIYRTVNGIETVRYVSSKGRHVSAKVHKMPRIYQEVYWSEHYKIIWQKKIQIEQSPNIKNKINLNQFWFEFSCKTHWKWHFIR